MALINGGLCAVETELFDKQPLKSDTADDTRHATQGKKAFSSSDRLLADCRSHQLQVSTATVR